MGSNTELPSPARRIVLMVRELHRLGYARLRLVPGMHPTSLHWRGHVTHAGNTRKSHGARLHRHGEDVARYVTREGDWFFGWNDARTDSPAELAAKFIERFPHIAALGRGDDPEYTRWYAEMVEATEPDGLIYAYSEWGDSSFEFLNVIGESRERTVPFPPSGKAEGTDFA